MRLRCRVLSVVACCCSLAVGGLARAEVRYLGKVVIDGKGKDLSGLRQTLEDGSPADGLDGFGSGLAYTGISPAKDTYRFVALADRGPNRTEAHPEIDHTTSYPTRCQVFDLTVKSEGTGFACSAKLVRTILFTDEAGRPLVGRSDQFSGQDPSRNLRFDPESIRVAPDGTLFVSDEYGPSVYHFDANGKRIGIMKVPAYYQVAHPEATEAREMAENHRGRTTNHGFEGLAITPDGSRVIAGLQAPLMQDGGDHTRYSRMAVFNARTGELVKEMVYPLDGSGKGNRSKHDVSDIVAINDHEVLVDERDGKKNKEKLAYVAELDGATDVKGRATVLEKGELAGDIVPVSKRLLFDVKGTILAKDTLQEVPAGYTAGIPDKIEGFAFGPRLADGRVLLVVSNDDDFVLPAFLKGEAKGNQSANGKAGYPNYFFFFAAEVPEFVPERFDGAMTAKGG